MIAFTCPKCGDRISAKNAIAGHYARCPKCQGQVHVPEFHPEPAEAAPSSTGTAGIFDVCHSIFDPVVALLPTWPRPAAPAPLPAQATSPQAPEPERS